MKTKHNQVTFMIRDIQGWEDIFEPGLENMIVVVTKDMILKTQDSEVFIITLKSILPDKYSPDYFISSLSEFQVSVPKKYVYDDYKNFEERFGEVTGIFPGDHVITEIDDFAYSEVLGYYESILCRDTSGKMLVYKPGLELKSPDPKHASSALVDFEFILLGGSRLPEVGDCGVCYFDSSDNFMEAGKITDIDVSTGIPMCYFIDPLSGKKTGYPMSKCYKTRNDAIKQLQKELYD